MRSGLLAFLITMLSLMDASAQGPVMKAKGYSFELAEFNVEATILGPLAETTMTMTFYNPHKRALEGELTFPLPEGATVSGYALDVNGVMIDGVVVKKKKARQTFETIARRRVDPGLVEKSLGNVFRTRVFPMPAKGSRKVRVSYVSQLNVLNKSYVFQLPLSLQKRVKKVSLQVELSQAVTSPHVKTSPVTNFVFEEWESGFIARTTLEDVELTKDLQVEIPVPAESQTYVERSPDGELFYLIHETNLPSPPAQLAQFKHVCVLWDTSNSAGSYDRSQDRKALEQCIASLPNDAVVHVIGFNMFLEPIGRFNGGAQGAADALKAISGVRYNGATRPGCLAELNKGGQPDCFLLFSDGMVTFGKTTFPKLRSPVFSFTSASRSDFMALRRLAVQTGGKCFNLSRVPVPVAVSEFRRQRIVLSKASDVTGEAYPSVGTAISRDLLFTGKTKGKTEISLQFRIGSSTWDTRHEVAVDIARPGGLLRRFWAQSKINELEILGADRKTIQKVGMKHGIVTSGTSLLVLESLAQYVEFRIPPPRSLPKMRAAYFAKIETQAVSPAKGPNIEELTKRWQQLITWWETKYKYVKVDPNKKREAKAADDGEVIEGIEDDVAAEQIAVRRDLRWSKHVQNEDGSWGDKAKNKPLLTGMTLLAYLANGETPLSQQYGRTVQNAMKWLANQANAAGDGKLIPSDKTGAGHVVATHALTESYAMTKIPFLQSASGSAVNAIIKRQKKNGAFSLGYAANGKDDLLFTVLNLNTLSSARLAGLDPKDTLKKGSSALKEVFFKNNDFLPGKSPAQTRLIRIAATSVLSHLGERDSVAYRKGFAAIMMGPVQFRIDTGDYPYAREILLGDLLHSNSSSHGTQFRAWRLSMEQWLGQNQQEPGYFEMPDQAVLKKHLTVKEQRIYATASAGRFSQVYYRYLPTFDRVSIVGDSDEGQALTRDDDDDEVLDVIRTSSPLRYSGPLGGRSNAGIVRGGTGASRAGLDINLTVAPVQGSEDHLKPDEQLADPFKTYLERKEKFNNAPAFHADFADLLFRKKMKKQAIKVLTNICEQVSDNPAFLRVVAHRLQSEGELDRAVELFEAIIELRPDEPQSHRDLALALAQRADQPQSPTRTSDYARALKLLAHVATGCWQRFESIRMIALVEYNHLLARTRKQRAQVSELDKRLLGAVDTDIRVVLSWDTDSTDIDLWVEEPNNEKCFYSNRQTRKGGRISKDITTGYGPEEYLLRKALPGTYRIRADYYGSRTTKLIGAVTVKVEIFRNFGRNDETREVVIRRLKSEKEVIDIATITIPGEPQDVDTPHPPKTNRTPPSEEW